MREKINRKHQLIMEEYATAYNSDLFSEVIVGTGVVSIATGELKLDTPANNDVAGLVTQIPYYLRNARITVNTVDVATSAPARAGIVIAKTKTTTGNPEALNDSLRIMLDAVNSHLMIVSDVGGAEKTLYDAAWTDGDGKLVLDVQPDGYFEVYEDAVLRYAGQLPFTGGNQAIFNLYIYEYTIGLTGTLGYGLLDNFQLDLDESPDEDTLGGGVRLHAEREMKPIIARIFDSAGTADILEDNKAITDTPVRKLILSRDAKKVQLISIRAFLNVTNAVTAGLHLFGINNADDMLSELSCFCSIANTEIADSTLYIKGPNDAECGGVGLLETPGQVPINIECSGAPGDTPGGLVFIFRELE